MIPYNFLSSISSLDVLTGTPQAILRSQLVLDYIFELWFARHSQINLQQTNPLLSQDYCLDYMKLTTENQRVSMDFGFSGVMFIHTWNNFRLGIPLLLTKLDVFAIIIKTTIGQFKPIRKVYLYQGMRKRMPKTAAETIAFTTSFMKFGAKFVLFTLWHLFGTDFWAWK